MDRGPGPEVGDNLSHRFREQHICECNSHVVIVADVWENVQLHTGILKLRDSHKRSFLLAEAGRKQHYQNMGRLHFWGSWGGSR